MCEDARTHKPLKKNGAVLMKILKLPLKQFSCASVFGGGGGDFDNIKMRGTTVEKMTMLMMMMMFD
jgi:hypothetical protein